MRSRSQQSAFANPVLIGAVTVLIALIAVFLAWLATAWVIFQSTMGPVVPTSPAAFAHDVFYTGPAEFRAYVKSELVKWLALIKEAGIAPE